jgi:hypothetical protein
LLWVARSGLGYLAIGGNGSPGEPSNQKNDAIFRPSPRPIQITHPLGLCLGSLDTQGRCLPHSADRLEVFPPVVAIETQADNPRRLKALYIDCGEKDQFNLLYGARRFVRRLNELGIAHRYEEFPDNHTGVDYRLDESLPFLAVALSG